MKRFIWTDISLRQLRQHYPHTTGAHVAKLIGTSLSSVYAKAKVLGLCKSAEFFASAESGRTTGQIGQQTRFASGQESWNKGKHYEAGGRSAETRFVAGAMPHNTKPIGSYRINGEGYLDLKVNNDKGANHVRWHPVHRLVWEEVNGKVPQGSMIVFRPGARTNKLDEITIDKVECITRAEHARRYQPYARGKEFGDLVIIKSQITRHVNRIQREAA
jgi:hypothetical protein